MSGRNEPCTFALWYARGAPGDFDVLARTLGGSERAGVRLVEDLDEWLRCDARVLVLRGGDRGGWRSVRSPGGGVRLDHRCLWGRRVLGIGHEAQAAFDSLGLETGAIATFPRRQAGIVIAPDDLVPEANYGDRMIAFDLDGLEGAAAESDCEAMHIPRWSCLAKHVGVLARWSDKDHYAPLVREQNYLWSGIASHAASWSDEFRGFIRAVAHSLARRPIEPFSLPVWPTTEPGTFDVRLAHGGSEGEPYQFVRRFRFAERVLFSAHVEVEEGSEVMLLLRAEASGMDSGRVDGDSGAALEISTLITEQSIRANQGRHWVLEVVNFGRVAARCKLTVRYERDAEVRLPGDILVRLSDPSQEDHIVGKVVDLLFHPDPAVWHKAKAALVMIGPQALESLHAARRRARDSTPDVESVTLDNFFSRLGPNWQSHPLARVTDLIQRIGWQT